MNHCPDGLVRAEFQEQVELVDGIWEFFGTTDQEGSKQISKLFSEWSV